MPEYILGLFLPLLKPYSSVASTHLEFSVASFSDIAFKSVVRIGVSGVNEMIVSSFAVEVSRSNFSEIDFKERRNGSVETTETTLNLKVLSLCFITYVFPLFQLHTTTAKRFCFNPILHFIIPGHFLFCKLLFL